MTQRGGGANVSRPIITIHQYTAPRGGVSAVCNIITSVVGGMG